MKRVLLLVAGDNGTIGACSLNLYEALKVTKGIKVQCAVVHHFDNGYPGFSDAVFFDTAHTGGIREQFKWLRKIKKQFQPDITISTLFSVNTLNVICGGKDKKFGIFHSPHIQLKAHGEKTYLLSLLEFTFIYPRLDKLCCVSQEVFTSLSTFPTISRKKKEVVYNIHNLDRIRKLAKLPIADDTEQAIFKKPTILYCGRLDSNKAPERALRAFGMAHLPKETQLVFLGEDQEKLTGRLQNMAKHLAIENRVHFLGRKSNPYPYFKAAIALISSSYSEGLPGVMIESLSLGTPVVSTNSSMGIWEIFSCFEDYDPDLAATYTSQCGVISSNLSLKDNSKYDLDIANLAKATEKVVGNPNNIDFLFSDKVNGANIVSQLLTL